MPTRRRCGRPSAGSTSSGIDHARQLAETISSLCDAQFAIFRAPDGSYVQVLKRSFEGYLLVEAVNFDSWEASPARPMTAEMRTRLEQMGFRPSDGGNYAFETRIDDLQSVQQLAGQLARTLHDVYGVGADEPLDVVVDS